MRMNEITGLPSNSFFPLDEDFVPFFLVAGSTWEKWKRMNNEFSARVLHNWELLWKNEPSTYNYRRPNYLLVIIHGLHLDWNLGIFCRFEYSLHFCLREPFLIRFSLHLSTEFCHTFARYWWQTLLWRNYKLLWLILMDFTA